MREEARATRVQMEGFRREYRKRFASFRAALDIVRKENAAGAGGSSGEDAAKNKRKVERLRAELAAERRGPPRRMRPCGNMRGSTGRSRRGTRRRRGPSSRSRGSGPSWINPTMAEIAAKGRAATITARADNKFRPRRYDDVKNR